MIIYFYTKQKASTHLNKGVYINDFNSYFKQLINTSTYSDKVKNKKIEITFNKIPDKFKIELKQHSFAITIFLVLHVITIRETKYKNAAQELNVSFKIRNSDNIVIKEGELTEIIEELNGKGNRFYNKKEFIKSNLFNFDFAIEFAMKRMASSILKELD